MVFGWLSLAGRAPIGRHALVGCKSQCVGGSLCREASFWETVCWWELNQSVAAALFGEKEFCGSYVGCTIHRYGMPKWRRCGGCLSYESPIEEAFWREYHIRSIFYG